MDNFISYLGTSFYLTTTVLGVVLVAYGWFAWMNSLGRANTKPPLWLHSTAGVCGFLVVVQFGIAGVNLNEAGRQPVQKEPAPPRVKEEKASFTRHGPEAVSAECSVYFRQNLTDKNQCIRFTLGPGGSISRPLTSSLPGMKCSIINPVSVLENKGGTVSVRVDQANQVAIYTNAGQETVMAQTYYLAPGESRMEGAVTCE